jgi:YidC/Oxa1 family membrane protein insertase
MENNRNFFITIALSVLILTLWQVFYMNPRIETQREAARIEAERVEQEKKAEPASPGVAGTDLPPQGAVPEGTPGSVPGTDGAAAATREAALAATARVKIDTPNISGSINLTGARIDDVRLKDYHLTIDKTSPIIELLNPAALPNGQYAEVGYAGTGDTGGLPGPDTVWTVEGADADAGDAGDADLRQRQGPDFQAHDLGRRRTTCSPSPTRRPMPAPPPSSLSNYGRVTRFDKPTVASIYVLHEGLIGVTGEEGLQEISYSPRSRTTSRSPRQVERRLARHHRQILGRGAGAVGQAAVPAALRLL